MKITTKGSMTFEIDIRAIDKLLKQTISYTGNTVT
jgi:hypothetical protein